MMYIQTARLVLRDFLPSDYQAFVAYQSDARYQRLYDISNEGDQRARKLFDLFLSWQQEVPRQNLQIGIFERDSGRLCGCAGLRKLGAADGTAVLGVELTPDDWGRYRLAIEVASVLINHGFGELGLHRIVGDTASGNKRVEKLARWFGADIVAQRPGPKWWPQEDGQRSTGRSLARDGPTPSNVGVAS